MFSTITEEQYQEILKLANLIYSKDVETKHGIPNDLEIERRNVERACKQYDHLFDKSIIISEIDHDDIEYNPEEAKKLFKLNLLFHNNNKFFNVLMKNCFIYFMTDDFETITKYYYSDQPGYKNRWDNIVKNISKVYYINEQSISEKIAEMMTYSNLYLPEKEKQGATRAW